MAPTPDSAPVSWNELVAVATIIGVLGSFVAGFVVWLWNQLSRQAKELAEFKVRVAERYVTADALTEIEKRLIQSVDRLTDRFDRVLDALGAGPRSINSHGQHG